MTAYLSNLHIKGTKIIIFHISKPQLRWRWEIRNGFDGFFNRPQRTKSLILSDKPKHNSKTFSKKYLLAPSRLQK